MFLYRIMRLFIIIIYLYLFIRFFLLFYLCLRFCKNEYKPKQLHHFETFYSNVETGISIFCIYINHIQLYYIHSPPFPDVPTLARYAMLTNRKTSTPLKYAYLVCALHFFLKFELSQKTNHGDQMSIL